MRRPSADAGDLLRAGLLGLAALGIAGTTVELVFLEHWGDLTRSMVWPAMLALTAGLALLVLLPRRTTLVVVRILSVVVLAIGLLGIWFHVMENLDAGPLDRRYADSWDGLPETERWALAVTGSVGPAPTLAPGVLVEISLALALATVAHPVARAATGPA